MDTSSNDIPEMKPVISSQISEIGYFEETQTLFIRFARGGLYSYSGVTAEQFEDFLNSESIGKHFAFHFRANPLHPYVKVIEVKEGEAV